MTSTSRTEAILYESEAALRLVDKELDALRAEKQMRDFNRRERHTKGGRMLTSSGMSRPSAVRKISK